MGLVTYVRDALHYIISYTDIVKQLAVSVYVYICGHIHVNMHIDINVSLHTPCVFLSPAGLSTIPILASVLASVCLPLVPVLVPVLVLVLVDHRK